MNIVYNASAGTGKTYQVTQLYEELVLEQAVDPREILLMTFTENAAAELRMRVYHRLLKARRTAEQEDHDERATCATNAIARLASAPICTIHSYCTRLLRENALEAGLSPGFSVLEGDERNDFINRICRDELLSRLDEDPDFKRFCSGAHIIGVGKGFGTSVTETVPNLIAQAGSLGISLENAEALLPDPLPPVSINEFRDIHSELQALPNRSKKVEEAMHLLGECIEEASDACSVADCFDHRFSGHFSYGDAQPTYHAFKALKEEARARGKYRERLPAAKAFARYVEAVAQKFQRQKHAMNAVDFDDLLQAARKLLKSERCTPSFRHIIVDEVQDTSRIQCDLIQALWQTAAQAKPLRYDDQDNRTAGGSPAPCLVICGDRKQSIYTWRGADPEVMPDLEKAIRETGGELRHLQTSYRSKAPILDVVNKLFASVYGQKAYSERDNLQPNPDFATDDEKACIEFLSPDEVEECSKQDQVTAEMQAVAHRIQVLVEGSRDWNPVYRYDDEFKPVDKSNRYRYSDILILLRRTTHQSALEQALRHAGIPYTCGGKGSGLFTRQETRDVSLFLNTLTNPNDMYSLIGFLRSPWIGMSDETIAELACGDEGFSSDELKTRYPQKTDIIDRYRAMLGTRLASELVRMLIDETGYDALLAGLPRGTQRLANLRKVLDWLRAAERGAHTTPAMVARKLSEQIAVPPQIPEAALLDPAQNAVTIMTVHGAKGLTKRVVFVPDMSFSANADRGLAQVCFDAQNKPTLELKVSAPDRTSAKSPGYDIACRRATAVREQESSNLFYVAMTRARDLVVTSASVGQKPSGWLQSIEPLIGTEIPAIPYSALAKAAVKPPLTPHHRPSVDQLAAAMASLPAPPKPSGLQRIPATRLAMEQDEMEAYFEDDERSMTSITDNAAALGSLGHAVLEQLALNNWQGSADDWLERLRDEFAIGKGEAGTLAAGIRETCALMIHLTSGMTEVHPEYPFVLHRDNHLIDGTIDLLCRTQDGFAIFDYKFTNTDPSAVIEQYRGQMEIYCRAAEKRYPFAAESRCELIVISSKGLQQLPIVF